MINFKSVTLELYNQDVKVTFIPGTECFRDHGPLLKGKLIGRIWGERFDEHSHEATVIGIMIMTNQDEYKIPCSEIDNIEKL